MKNDLILVVDDHPQNLHVMNAILKKANYRVASANSGKQALKALENMRPDLILLDVSMPEMDGLEVCRQVKANPELSNTPVIFLSARTETEDIQEGFAAGGVDYLAKPFLSIDLLTRIKTHLALKHSRDLIQTYSEQLAERNQQLETLNQEKNHFLGIAAHDLKNPLINILTLSQLLNSENTSTLEKIDEYFPLIELSANQMLAIIEQLLDVNRIESGGIDVQAKQIDLTPYLKNLCQSFQHAALAKSITFDTEWPEGENWIQTDPQLLIQILDNLVSNAIKFTPQERRIKLSLQKTPTQYLISIFDQGPGFTDKDRKLLFQKFARLSAQPTGNEISTGLGLSIVKLLIGLINAEIDLETSSEGSCFTLTLPRHQ